MDKATIYQNLGNITKSKENWYNSLIVDPEYLGAELLVDYLSYLLNEISYEEIIEKYHYKIKRSISNNDKSEVSGHLSQFYSVHGQIDSSIYYANNSVQLYKDNSSPMQMVWRNLFRIPNYIYIGRYDIAINIYEEYGKTGQTKDNFLSNVWLKMHENKIVEAKKLVNNKLETKIIAGELLNLSEHYLLNGLISLKENQYQDAIVSFKKILSYSSGSTPDYFSFSRVSGSDIDVYLLISQVYFQLNDTQASFEWALKAYKISPFEPLIQYQMALIEHDTGNHDKAKEYLEYCLDFWKYADEDFSPSIEAKKKWSEWNQVN